MEAPASLERRFGDIGQGNENIVRTNVWKLAGKEALRQDYKRGKLLYSFSTSVHLMISYPSNHHRFTPSFNKHRSHTCFVAGTKPGPADTEMDRNTLVPELVKPLTHVTLIS